MKPNSYDWATYVANIRTKLTKVYHTAVCINGHWCITPQYHPK